jgi:hypothetical protein
MAKHRRRQAGEGSISMPPVWTRPRAAATPRPAAQAACKADRRTRAGRSRRSRRERCAGSERNRAVGPTRLSAQLRRIALHQETAALLMAPAQRTTRPSSVKAMGIGKTRLKAVVTQSVRPGRKKRPWLC